jgi:undecaprenyl-diphosphatase
MDMSDIWLAVILGMVEGLTEYLPISSTGHLIVVGNILNYTGEKAAAFEVFIQLGAILAVVVLYWKRFTGLIPYDGRQWKPGNGFSSVRGLALLALTTLPALAAGFLAHRFIKAHLFSPTTVALALGLGGIGMLLAERYKPASQVAALDELKYAQAFMVGLFQCLALWPGMSRSACTIVGGMFSGLDRRTAAEYSFLAAVPIMLAATSYDLYKEFHLLECSDQAFFFLGFLVAFASAIMAVRTFLALVQRWSLAPYAWYRIVAAPLIYFAMK